MDSLVRPPRAEEEGAALLQETVGLLRCGFREVVVVPCGGGHTGDSGCSGSGTGSGSGRTRMEWRHEESHIVLGGIAAVPIPQQLFPLHVVMTAHQDGRGFDLVVDINGPLGYPLLSYVGSLRLVDMGVLDNDADTAAASAERARAKQADALLHGLRH